MCAVQPEAEHGFIVLAYGASPWLEACLGSLRAQSRPSPISITTSTPSPEIAASAARHAVELIVNPQCAGIAADWNFALARAPWPFVTLAHQDDIYLPAFTARSLEALHRYPRAALVFTGHAEIDSQGQPRSGKVIRAKRLITALAAGFRLRALGPARRVGLLACGNPLGCSTVTFARQRLEGFAFEDGWHSNLDWAAWWQLHQLGHQFAYVPDVLVERRYDDSSATSRLLADGSRAREDARMFARIWPEPVAQLLTRAYRAGYR